MDFHTAVQELHRACRKGDKDGIAWAVKNAREYGKVRDYINYGTCVDMDSLVVPDRDACGMSPPVLIRSTALSMAVLSENVHVVRDLLAMGAESNGEEDFTNDEAMLKVLGGAPKQRIGPLVPYWNGFYLRSIRNVVYDVCSACKKSAKREIICPGCNRWVFCSSECMDLDKGVHASLCDSLGRNRELISSQLDQLISTYEQARYLALEKTFCGLVEAMCEACGTGRSRVALQDLLNLYRRYVILLCRGGDNDEDPYDVGVVVPFVYVVNGHVEEGYDMFMRIESWRVDLLMGKIRMEDSTCDIIRGTYGRHKRKIGTRSYDLYENSLEQHKTLSEGGQIEMKIEYVVLLLYIKCVLIAREEEKRVQFHTFVSCIEGSGVACALPALDRIAEYTYRKDVLIRLRVELGHIVWYLYRRSPGLVEGLWMGDNSQVRGSAHGIALMPAFALNDILQPLWGCIFRVRSQNKCGVS